MALPGVFTVLRDRFYSLSRTDIPVGPRVLAIAPRNTASGTGGVSDYDPYLATDEQNVVTAFGFGSGAHRAYVELVTGGAQTVYIVAIPQGTTDSQMLSTGASSPLDLAMAAAETAQPDFIVPWGRGGSPDEWGVQGATPNAATPNYASVNYGFYADNAPTASTSAAVRVAQWCSDITNRSHPVLGVMGLKPYVNTANATDKMTAAQIATQLTYPNLISRADPTLLNTGPYLVVVGAELIPLGSDPTFGYANGACSFAAQLAQTKSWSSPTGKLVYNVSGVRYNPTRTQQQAVINQGINPLALNFARSATWVEGKTFGIDTSDYTRISTMRIVYDAVLMVRTVAQQFIGEAATLANRNALETAITSGLRGMQQQGALLASDFRVSYIPSQNQANIDLVLTPAFELRNIQVTVAVQIGA